MIRLLADLFITGYMCLTFLLVGILLRVCWRIQSKKVVYFIYFAGCFIPFYLLYKIVLPIFKEALDEIPGFSLAILLCLGFVSIVLFIIIIQNNQMYNCKDEQNTKRLNNKEHNKKHRRAIKKKERKRIKK